MTQVGYIHTAIGYRIFGNRNPAGAARLSGLGDDSQIMADLGFSPGQIQQILQFHASGALSDNGFQFLLQGGVPTTDLDNFLNQDPGASSAPSSSSQAAGVPTGTALSYQGTWETSLHNSDPQDILRRVASVLNGYGLQVLGRNASVGIGGTIAAAAFVATQFNVTISMRVIGAGFDKPSDVVAIIDHQVYGITGQMPLASGINVSGGISGGLPATNLATWFEQNIGTVFFGLAALFVLPQLVKKL